MNTHATVSWRNPGIRQAMGRGMPGLTVVVSPLTGRTKIEKGLVDLPDPRTDKEEDQGDREGL